MRRALIAAALMASAVAPALVTPAWADPYGVAVLQALDKVTARVTTLDAPLGETVKYNTLEIIARACDKKPPEETPESTAFLDIWEARPGEPMQGVFRGWMFASSPAVSAMEHPVYDVWVLDCKNPITSESKEPDDASDN
ncbi:MAG: Conserved exported protein of unknown function [Rhodospirillales bacterium]|jgi:hypothetical protein|nr:Conserved exported protein of unknown function [Rhodospirillales bacterium]